MRTKQCSAEVFGDWHARRCTRTASVERDGKGYCKQHDPVAKAERDAARQAKWNKDFEAKTKVYRLHDAATDLLSACKEAEDLFAPDAFDGVGESCGAACIRALRAAIKKAEEVAP